MSQPLYWIYPSIQFKSVNLIGIISWPRDSNLILYCIGMILGKFFFAMSKKCSFRIIWLKKKYQGHDHPVVFKTKEMVSRGKKHALWHVDFRNKNALIFFTCFPWFPSGALSMSIVDYSTLWCYHCINKWFPLWKNARFFGLDIIRKFCKLLQTICWLK